MDDQIRFYEEKLKFEIDSWDLYEAIKNGDDVVVIDARASTVYEKSHIPTAINIPHRTMDESSTSHLNRKSLYVTYCDGIGCNASTKGALNMARLGFNVKELLGGLDWWLRDGYSTEGAEATEGKVVACGC